MGEQRTPTSSVGWICRTTCCCGLTPARRAQEGYLLLTQVRKEVAAFGVLSHECICAGRVSRTTLVHRGGEIRVWNVHNYGLDAAQTDAAVGRIEADGHLASDDPLARTALLLGDFNLPYGDVHVHYQRPGPGNMAPAGGQHRRRWERVLSEFTEVTDGEPTHYTAASGVSARLDRTFVSVPGWAAYGLVVRSELQGDSRGIHHRRLSDHSPIILCMQTRGMLAAILRADCACHESGRSIRAGTPADAGALGVRRLGGRRQGHAIPSRGPQRGPRDPRLAQRGGGGGDEEREHRCCGEGGCDAATSGSRTPHGGGIGVDPHPGLPSCPSISSGCRRRSTSSASCG